MGANASTEADIYYGEALDPKNQQPNNNLFEIKRLNESKGIRPYSENGAVDDSLDDNLKKTKCLKIIHFSDLTEARQMVNSGCPGASRFVYEVNKERKNKLNSERSPLVLFSGDAVGPSILRESFIQTNIETVSLDG